MKSYVLRTRLAGMDLDMGESPPLARSAYRPRKPGISRLRWNLLRGRLRGHEHRRRELWSLRPRLGCGTGLPAWVVRRARDGVRPGAILPPGQTHLHLRPNPLARDDLLPLARQLRPGVRVSGGVPKMLW
jgi:hypothetical protein